MTLPGDIIQSGVPAPVVPGTIRNRAAANNLGMQ